MGTVDAALDWLRAKEATTSCAELIAVLQGLGFEVRRRSSGNHHTIYHPGLSDFSGSNFDGGHGKVVKKYYVQAMRKLISKYQSELTEYMREQT